MTGATESGNEVPLWTGTPRDRIPGDGVPIQPAATILLVADRPELPVLVLRRTEASTFVAGHTLFPGGRVDDGDRDPRWPDLVVGRTASDAVRALGADDGLGPRRDTVGKWVRRLSVDDDRRAGVTIDERQRLRVLELESRELRRANEIFKTASTFFAADLDGPRR